MVVWIEDSNGQLVPEIEGHGISSIPGTLTSLEQVNEEAYSNNVGFSDSILHVLSKPLFGAEPATTTAVDIGKIDISDSTAVRGGRPVIVSATLQAGSVDVSGITVKFYDGDPQTDGTIFNTEQVPYIAANGTFRVSSLIDQTVATRTTYSWSSIKACLMRLCGERLRLRVHCGKSK